MPIRLTLGSRIYVYFRVHPYDILLAYLCKMSQFKTSLGMHFPSQMSILTNDSILTFSLIFYEENITCYININMNCTFCYGRI